MVFWKASFICLSVYLSVCLSVCSTEELGNTNGQLIVLLQKPHGASLGISLYGECVCPVQYCCLSNITVLAHSGSSTPGSPLWISRIRDAGIADRLVNHTLQQPWLPLLPRRSGALHVGDQLLSINSYPMAGRTVQEANHLLSDSDINVRLEIIPYHNFPDRPSFTPTMDDGENTIKLFTSYVYRVLNECTSWVNNWLV